MHAIIMLPQCVIVNGGVVCSFKSQVGILFEGDKVSSGECWLAVNI